MASPLLRRQEIVFDHQSQSIHLSEWLNLLTLCFAPLVAHLLIGVVEPTVLAGKVSWRERICHYNPTSIVWRYFAITDRRCRAEKWSKYDLAATNAIFWDGKRWDGSVEIMTRMRYTATKIPAGPRASLASKSIFQTLIVSLQGIQAIYVVAVYTGGKVALPGHPISEVFYPLAILGLLRLPAALWLTEEYGYREFKGPRPSGENSEVELDQLLPSQRSLVREGIPTADGSSPSKQFYLQGSWRGILVRIGFLGTLLVLTGVSAAFLAMNLMLGTRQSLSGLVSQIFYLFLIACTTSAFSVYIWKGKANTTVIPCVNSPLFKAYTYVLFLFAIGLLIISALETRRTACGLYTTNPIDWGLDDAMCKFDTVLK